MIGVDDEDENPNERNVLGFTTILNVNYYQVRSNTIIFTPKQQDVMKEIIAYVLNKSESHNEQHNDLLQILQGEPEKVGLVINERMINLSPQLVPTLHNQLCEDIKWNIQENTEEAPLFDLKYLLFFSK
jgi:hypothetical protein